MRLGDRPPNSYQPDCLIARKMYVRVSLNHTPPARCESRRTALFIRNSNLTGVPDLNGCPSCAAQAWPPPQESKALLSPPGGVPQPVCPAGPQVLGGGRGGPHHAVLLPQPGVGPPPVLPARGRGSPALRREAPGPTSRPPRSRAGPSGVEAARGEEAESMAVLSGAAGLRPDADRAAPRRAERGAGGRSGCSAGRCGRREGLRAGWTGTCGRGWGARGWCGSHPHGGHAGSCRVQGCRAADSVCGVTEGLVSPFRVFQWRLSWRKKGGDLYLPKAFPELLYTRLSFETFTKFFKNVNSK